MPSEPGTGYLLGITAIAVTCALLVIYYLITRMRPSGIRILKETGDEKAQARVILFTRFVGGLIFGITPVVLSRAVYGRPLTDFGLYTGAITQSLMIWLPATALVFITVFYLARRENMLDKYPQIRTGEWNAGLITTSALGWLVYLTGYEILFRGLLLFACYMAFGFWPAILINIAVYLLAHIPKGTLETIGSIPLGFLFSFVTLKLGSIWFALLTHITIALANEWVSIYFNRRMKAASTKGPGR